MLIFFSVLYNPDINALKNIKLAKSLGILPIVYLNKVETTLLNELTEMGVVLLGNNNNVGLGFAFYELEQYLISTSYNFFIYFDQDTEVKEIAWLYILETYKFNFISNSVGLLYYGYNFKSSSKLVISSGSLFSMNIVKELGFHDKSYFVEGVDYEFCLRLNFYGYKITKIKCSGIDHHSLQDFFTVKIFSKIFNLRVYGKSRTKDFNISHKYLLHQAYKFRNYSSYLFLLKSIIRHNIMELISRKFINF